MAADHLTNLLDQIFKLGQDDQITKEFPFRCFSLCKQRQTQSGQTSGETNRAVNQPISHTGNNSRVRVLFCLVLLYSVTFSTEDLLHSELEMHTFLQWPFHISW